MRFLCLFKIDISRVEERGKKEAVGTLKKKSLITVLFLVAF